MRKMIHRAAVLAVLAAPCGACSSGPETRAQAGLPTSAGQSSRIVAAAVTAEPTWTPAIIVIVPPATPTVPPSSTPQPTRTLAPTRTPAPPTTTLPSAATSRAAQPTGSAAAGSVAATTGRASSSPAPRATATRPGPSATPRPRLPTDTPAPTEDRRLVAQLRRGGLVVYLRHGQTDWGQNDRELAWVPEMLSDRSLLLDCGRQRLLNDAGRDQARRIGAAIARHGIPVGTVMSSQWCRTRETAELAFGRVDVAGDRLFDTGYLEAGSQERKAYAAALRELLSSPIGDGSNRFLVAHGPQIDDAARVVLQEGDAVVFRPTGGGFEQVARLTPAGWESLAD